MDIVQSISSPHGVSTFGSAVVRLDPDQAIVEFSISVVEPNPADAFNALRQRAAAVNGTMNRLGAENVTFKTSQTLFEESHMVSKLKGSNTAFRAWLEYRSTIKNLQYVDTVLTSIVDAGGMSMRPLHYTSTRLQEARAESRQMAVLAALRKAELYAEAAGVDIGRVLHIEDIDPARLSARAGKLYDFDELQMAGAPRPGAIDVIAAVLVSYAIKGAGTPETTGQYRVL